MFLKKEKKTRIQSFNLFNSSDSKYIEYSTLWSYLEEMVYIDRTEIFRVEGEKVGSILMSHICTLMYYNFRVYTDVSTSRVAYALCLADWAIIQQIEYLSQLLSLETH